MPKSDGLLRIIGPSLGWLLAGLPLCAVTTGALAQPREAAAVADTLVDYRMARGDHLYALARLYFLRQSDFAVVQRINHIADPLQIPVGTVLRIPARLLRSEPLEARVEAVRGTASIQQGGSAGNPRPAAGMAVRPGAVLETGADGFLGLTLSNGSQISIPTRSRVRILAMRRFLLTKGVDFDIAVDRGKFETQATPLSSGASQFRLRTPRAVSAIRGTVLRVGYQPDREDSMTEVLDGSVAVQSAGGSAQAAIVPKGRGAVVAATGSVKTEALLAAPEIDDPGRIVSEPVAAFLLRPVPGARGYHVQVAADAGFSDLVGEATAGGTQVALPALGNGRWFARVSAIAASGLEGESQVYSIRRVLAGLDAGAEQDADRLKFNWSGAGAGQRIYRFQMFRGDPRTRPMVDEPGLSTHALTVSGVDDGVYYWRVGMRQYADGDVVENWLPFQKLTVTGAGR
ncbi:MAG TPA: FecR domain-containing protein [Sphingobium sp.]